MTLAAIDVPSLYARDFYATSNPKKAEELVHAQVRWIASELASHIIACFDSPPSFRAERFPAYKGTRSPHPDGYTDHLEILREDIRAYTLKLATYEADDLIATVAARCDAARAGGTPIDCLIVSSDKDLWQCADEHTSILLPGKWERLGPDQLASRFIHPSKVIDYKALCGDSSDNYTGVPGLGDKTARSILDTHGSVADFLRLDPTHKAALRITEHRPQYDLCRWLAELATDAPVERFKLTECRSEAHA